VPISLSQFKGTKKECITLSGRREKRNGYCHQGTGEGGGEGKELFRLTQPRKTRKKKLAMGSLRTRGKKGGLEDDPERKEERKRLYPYWLPGTRAEKGTFYCKREKLGKHQLAGNRGGKSSGLHPNRRGGGATNKISLASIRGGDDQGLFIEA